METKVVNVYKGVEYMRGIKTLEVFEKWKKRVAEAKCANETREWRTGVGSGSVSCFVSNRCFGRKKG